MGKYKVNDLKFKGNRWEVWHFATLLFNDKNILLERIK